MSDRTKEIIKFSCKIAGIVGLSALAALTTAGLYASGAGVFFLTVGVLNLVAEAVGIRALFRKWLR